MIEELQAAWDRPGEVFFEAWDGKYVYDPELDESVDIGPGWNLGWKITRPIKMWLGGEQTHQYGDYVWSTGEVDCEVIFETLDLVREQFDLTMQILDWPAWRRFLWAKLPK